jgi:hypothetical protein
MTTASRVAKLESALVKPEYEPPSPPSPMPALIAYHVGKLDPQKESPAEGFARALYPEIQEPAECTRAYRAALHSGDPDLDARYQAAIRKMFRARRCNWDTADHETTWKVFLRLIKQAERAGVRLPPVPEPSPVQ